MIGLIIDSFMLTKTQFAEDMPKWMTSLKFGADGHQTYGVEEAGTYVLEIAGAAGGGENSGKGAVLSGLVFETAFSCKAFDF